MAAIAGLLPLAAIRWLPGGREERRTARARRMPGARSSGWMAGAALRLPLIFAAATIAAGVLDSFLPLAKGIPSSGFGLTPGPVLATCQAKTHARLIGTASGG
jgi:hypothetical protein